MALPAPRWPFSFLGGTLGLAFLSLCFPTCEMDIRIPNLLCLSGAREPLALTAVPLLEDHRLPFPAGGSPLDPLVSKHQMRDLGPERQDTRALPSLGQPFQLELAMWVPTPPSPHRAEQPLGGAAEPWGSGSPSLGCSLGAASPRLVVRFWDPWASVLEETRDPGGASLAP